MRLFRAVRAVGLSLVLVCGVRPSMRRLRAVWRYACVVRARARFLGGAVRWFAVVRLSLCDSVFQLPP